MSASKLEGSLEGLSSVGGSKATVEIWEPDGIPESLPESVPVEFLYGIPRTAKQRLTQSLLGVVTTDPDGRFSIDKSAISEQDAVYLRIFGADGLLASDTVSISDTTEGPALQLSDKATTPGGGTSATATALTVILAGCSGLFGGDGGRTPSTPETPEPATSVTDSAASTAGTDPATPSEPQTTTHPPTDPESEATATEEDDGVTFVITQTDTPSEPTATQAETPTDTQQSPTDTETVANDLSDSPNSPAIRTPEPPELDMTTTTSVQDRSAFLYDGEEPVQRDVEPSSIDEQRVSRFSGRVILSDGTPLAGVTVWVDGSPELGWTATRDDGRFDMVVNGGGRVTLAFAKDGYLQVRRSVTLAWNEETTIEDVVLKQPSGEGTTVEMDTDEAQVVQGTAVTDEDGSRQAVVLIPPKTAAMWTDSGTAPQTLTVRTAEYTVGDSGPAAMPAGLPSSVAYTYASEFFAEASGDGSETTSTPSATATPTETATDSSSGSDSGSGSQTSDRAFIGEGTGGDLTFDRPVIFYLENFLDFPVGTPVPVGAYDRGQRQWIPSTDGLILEILKISEGKAVLDLTGDGTADNLDALELVGIGDAEREQLATLYDAGQELWRTPLPHFTPWDCNWPFGLPPGAEGPNLDPEDEPDDEDPCP